jgi:hypothetical protein
MQLVYCLVRIGCTNVDRRMLMSLIFDHSTSIFADCQVAILVIGINISSADHSHSKIRAHGKWSVFIYYTMKIVSCPGRAELSRNPDTEQLSTEMAEWCSDCYPGLATVVLERIRHSLSVLVIFAWRLKHPLAESISRVRTSRSVSLENVYATTVKIKYM